jgi:hypothetical protein
MLSLSILLLSMIEETHGVETLGHHFVQGEVAHWARGFIDQLGVIRHGHELLHGANLGRHIL